MTDTQILTRFAVVTLIVFAAVTAIGFALRLLFEYEMGTGLGIVTIIVPAMEAGQTHARRAGTALGSGHMWRLSALMGLISAVLSSALALALAALTGTALPALPTGTFLIVAAVVMIVYILAARFFLGFGQRLELKRGE
ncbi:MAG: ABZJ_00895 family protein [Pseudomonadota bacterium]